MGPNKWKSHSDRSRLFQRWSNPFQGMNHSMSWTVYATWRQELSWVLEPLAPRIWIIAYWPAWTDSASGMLVFNHITLFPFTVNKNIHLNSQWSTTGVLCTQPCDHLWMAVFAGSIGKSVP
jgi:hypothetical protein